MFNNQDNNGKENNSRKIYKSAEKNMDVNEIINSKPVANNKKKKTRKTFSDE